MWVFDRLSIDGGMTLGEQKDTHKQVGRALLGQPSVASSYSPDDWADSVSLKKTNERQSKP
jgi:hypothetical protein